MSDEQVERPESERSTADELRDYMRTGGPPRRLSLFTAMEGDVVLRLRRQRLESLLSQAELARRISDLGIPMHQTTIAKIESGDRPLRLAELFALAEALGVPWLAMAVGPPTDDRAGDARAWRIELAEQEMASTRGALIESLDTLGLEYAEAYARQMYYSRSVAAAAAKAIAEGTDGTPAHADK